MGYVGYYLELIFGITFLTHIVERVHDIYQQNIQQLYEVTLQSVH